MEQWKQEIKNRIESGCSEYDIRDFVEKHPEINGKEIWDYAYEFITPIDCHGCKHIQLSGMYPCCYCIRQNELEDYYEHR